MELNRNIVTLNDLKLALIYYKIDYDYIDVDTIFYVNIHISKLKWFSLMRKYRIKKFSKFIITNGIIYNIYKFIEE
jgi:hypothetical protein